MSGTPSPGPWEIDTVQNDGEYGNNGPDTRSGFKSYVVIDAQGRALFDSLNRDGAVTEVHEDEDFAWDELARRDLTLAAAAPELLAALRRAKSWIDIEMEAKGWPRERIESPPAGSHLDAINVAIAKAGSPS